MNLKKWVNYLLIIISLPLFAICCDKCPEDFQPCIPKNTPLIWDSIFTDNMDNSAEKVKLSSNDSVPKAAFGIRLNFNIAPYPTLPRGSDSCVFLIPADTIVDFKIYTVYDFDATHSAGSDVSDYFKIGSLKKDYYSNINNNYSYNTFSSIPDYLLTNKKQELFYQLDFLLTKAPQMNLVHQFNVKILEKNTTVTALSNPVKLY
jgi:hypothetical protein